MAFNLLPSEFLIDKISSRDLINANYTDENALMKLNPTMKPWHDLTKGQMLNYVATATPNIYAQNGGSMLDNFSKTKTTRYVDSEYIRWSLKGTNKTKVYLVENMQPTNPTPCIGFSEITLKFSHGLWGSGDVIYPEKHPSLEFIVNGTSPSDGTGANYTMQLKTKNEFEYVEPEIIAENTIWCKRGANHGEASHEYGTSSYTGGASILTYQTQLGSFSMKHKVSDKANHLMLRARAMDSQGKDIDHYPHQVILFEEAEMQLQAKYLREQSLFWGRDAGYNLLDPTSGYHRRTAPGALEFYEDGNLMEYDEENVTVDFLRERFGAFFYGRISPSNARIKVKCGLALLTLINKALTKEYAMTPTQKPYNDYVKQGNSFPGSAQPGRHLTAPQFMGFDMFPYGVIEFEHFPILDDVDQHGGFVHPKTGKPLTSYWGFVDDIMGEGPNNNVEHLILQNSEYYNYICGTYSPVGPINHGSNRGSFVSTHDGRYYTIVYSIIEGIVMKDTKRTVFIHPQVSR